MLSNRPLFFLLVFLMLSSGCAQSYLFKNANPLQHAGDNLPSPVPAKDTFNFVEYSVTSSVRYPLVEGLDFRRTPRSQDVNSYDQVPASTWWTPRLGVKNISPAELVRGPEDKGPPQLPITILKVKTKGNSPGFIIQDARGFKYIIKFDLSDYPALESTANFVANRLFWGFGYFVPEDHPFHFPSAHNDIILGKGVSQDDVDQVLIFSHVEDDGRYPSVASLFIEGEILGPIPQKGTRKNDPNDKIPNENRRSLRALKMFCAWLNNSGMRSDNSLDVYVGSAGQGHTLHYILDFGETFGNHGLEKGRPWDGFERFFDFGDLTRNFFNFGFPLKKWEKINKPEHPSLGSFESIQFDPAQWKSSVQFLPMEKSQPDDDYWASKIIAAIRPEHLSALFGAVNHPDSEYIKLVNNILLHRREKILNYAFSRVSPLEFVALNSTHLILEDLGKEILKDKDNQYRVRFLNSKSKQVAAELALTTETEKVEISLEEARRNAQGYLILDIRVIRQGRPAPRSAQFHISDSGNTPTLVGITH